MKKVIIFVVAFAWMFFVAVSCNKRNTVTAENIQYVTVETGGCNTDASLKSGDSKTNGDSFVITVAKESE
jgi:hypothetical protein